MTAKHNQKELFFKIPYKMGFIVGHSFPYSINKKYIHRKVFAQEDLL